ASTCGDFGRMLGPCSPRARLAMCSMITIAVMLVASAAEAKTAKGTLTRRNFSHAGCSIASMEVSYVFDAFGNATVNGAFKWQASAGTAKDCLGPDTRIW